MAWAAIPLHTSLGDSRVRDWDTYCTLWWSLKAGTMCVHLGTVPGQQLPLCGTSSQIGQPLQPWPRYLFILASRIIKATREQLDSDTCVVLREVRGKRSPLKTILRSGCNYFDCTSSIKKAALRVPIGRLWHQRAISST